VNAWQTGNGGTVPAVSANANAPRGKRHVGACRRREGNNGTNHGSPNGAVSGNAKPGVQTCEQRGTRARGVRNRRAKRSKGVCPEGRPKSNATDNAKNPQWLAASAGGKRKRLA